MTPTRHLLLVVALGVAASPSASAYVEPELWQPKAEFLDPKHLEPALRRALETKGGFCKDPEYELTSSERRLCSLASRGAERCPGFVRACEKAGAGAHRSSRRVNESDREEGSSGPLGALLGGFVELLSMAVLALGIGAMIWAIVSALLGRRRDASPDGELESKAATVRVPRLSPTATPEELLAQSRELALSGEVRAAMAVVLRALLRHFEIGGHLELHASRTNGDYVRSLKRQGHDPRDLRQVSGEVEAIEFGGGRASPEAFSALHARVSKLVHLGAILLVCLSTGALTGCVKRPPHEGSVSSCGAGASGYSALCETLTARGAKVRRRFTSIQSVGDDVARVAILKDDLSAAERKVLLEWVEAGGTLVVFDRVHAYDERLGLSMPCNGEVVLGEDVWSAPAGAKYRFGLQASFGLKSVPGGRVHARCGEEPFALEVDRALGTIIAVADQRFPMNASLAIGQNAGLAAALVDPTGATVELIGDWTGTGSDLPMRSLSRAGLLPWFLQLLAFGFAFALYRGSPFGSRREPVSVTRRAFAEHAIALGDAYSRAKASRQALVNFGSWALERLRVRLAATKHGRLSDLAGAVAARHSVSEAEVMGLVVAVRSAEDQAHDSASEAEHLAAVRRLAALVKKTGGST